MLILLTASSFSCIPLDFINSIIMDSPNHVQQEAHGDAEGKMKMTSAPTSSSTMPSKDMSTTYELYLASVVELRDRGDKIIKELKCIEPYTLSTNEHVGDPYTLMNSA